MRDVDLRSANAAAAALKLMQEALALLDGEGSYAVAAVHLQHAIDTLQPPQREP